MSIFDGRYLSVNVGVGVLLGVHQLAFGGRVLVVFTLWTHPVIGDLEGVVVVGGEVDGRRWSFDDVVVRRVVVQCIVVGVRLWQRSSRVRVLQAL